MTIGNIVSVLIFLFVMLIFTIIISNSKDLKKTKKHLIIFVFILSFFGFIFKPLTPIDLTRLQETLPNYINYSVLDIISQIPKTADFSRLFYFWIISKTKIDNLLQVGAIFIFYSSNFYVIYNFCKNRSASCKTLSKALITFMLFGQFIFVTSGIRTALAFSIFLYSFYREYFENKNIILSLILYLVAIGFHSAVIPIFIIRMSLMLFDKKSSNTKLFNFFMIFLLFIIVFIYGNEIIESFIGTSNTYLNNYIYYNRPEYYLAVLKICLHVVIYFLGRFYIKRTDYYDKMKNYLNFIFIIIVITIILSFQYTIFTRYTYFVDSLIIPLLIMLLDKEKINNKKGNIRLFEMILIFFLILILMLAYFKANASIINFF